MSHEGGYGGQSGHGHETNPAVSDLTQLGQAVQTVYDAIQERNTAILAERELLGPPSAEDRDRQTRADLHISRDGAARIRSEQGTALLRTGLDIESTVPHFVVADGRVLATALGSIPTGECPPPVAHTLGRTIGLFLRDAVDIQIVGGGERLRPFQGIFRPLYDDPPHLSELPPDLSSASLEDIFMPDHETYTHATHATQELAAHGQEVAAQLARLGVDPETVHRLEGFSLAATENLLFDWAVLTDLGLLGNRNAMGYPWERFDQMTWERVYPFLEELGQRAGGDSQFAAHVRQHVATRMQAARETLREQLARESTENATAISSDAATDALLAELAQPQTSAERTAYVDPAKVIQARHATRYHLLGQVSARVQSLLGGRPDDA